VRKPSGQICYRLMRLLIISALLTICFAAIGQTFSTKKGLTFYPGTYIDNEHRYTDSTGLSVIIQNSLASWGGFLFHDSTETGGYSYTSAGKKEFGCVVFWYRVVNETDSPIVLTVNFPVDSFANQYYPEAYFRLYLPSDTMDLTKEGLANYGLKGLRAFLDVNFYRPTRLQKVIGRSESYMFYVALMDHYPDGVGGVTVRQTRAQLVLDKANLFYYVNLHGSDLIPCGQIKFRQ
jgi:hypothetical protein